MRLWHFLGDVFEWLGSWPHVSGVQRVALELLRAGCSAPREESDGVCTLATSHRWIASVPTTDALAFFGPWLSSSSENGRRRSAVPGAETLLWPTPDEAVIFTGLVWTPVYTEIFRRLSAFGVRFGVLIHDIIPLQRQDLATPEEAGRFGEWLRVTLATADAIFVSTEVTADAIRRWATDRGFVIKGRITVIPFGRSHLAAVRSASGSAPNGVVMDPAGFVLSVGTIDKRKNQTALIPVWTRLVAELGVSAVPQLVLAGRPNLRGLNLLTGDLQRIGKLVILNAASDEELSWLYQNCRFTAFPSLCEGYGLPVVESLSYGKACVASSLPELHELMGDLVWYFDPSSESDLYRQIELAISDTDRCRAMGRTLSANFGITSWDESLATIRKALTPPTEPNNI